MTSQSTIEIQDTLSDPAHWTRVLAKYRGSDLRRSLTELAVTLFPFLAIWALAWAALDVSVWLSLALALVNALFLVRLFMIQHDCGHGAFFASRRLGDWTGRLLGVLTMTPYEVWRKTHAVHHAHTGNLDRRGVGDIPTLTVAEYRALSPVVRFFYRLYRNPLVLFGVVPAFVFLVRNRIPVKQLRGESRYWISAMGTNAAIAAMLGAIYLAGGLQPILWIMLPTLVAAASIGMWLFFVQHQFEDTTWEHEDDWQIHHAALHGSSYYELPGPLRWFSANIGVHHVHHLASRIPFYKLDQVLRDHPVLATCQRLTLRESLGCARLHLWDETQNRLLSFDSARRAAA